MINSRTCPICGSSKNKIYLAGVKFKLFKCERCELIRTEVEKGADKIYPGINVYEDKKAALSQITEKTQQYKKYSKNTLNFANIKPGRFLDIGCGIGWTVKEAKNRGFNSIGLDSSKIYTEVGKENFKVELIHISLERYKTRQKFDLISMNHVLEHVQIPNQVLSKIKSLLNEHGSLMISVPNIDSIMFKIFKTRWYGLVPTQHHWQFSPNTLSKILQKNGFIVVKIETNNLDYDVLGLKGLLFKLITFIAPKINQGDQIFLLAQKK